MHVFAFVKMIHNGNFTIFGDKVNLFFCNMYPLKYLLLKLFYIFRSLLFPHDLNEFQKIINLNQSLVDFSLILKG